MIKKVVLFTFLLASINLIAQKPQRFGYIDMEYILENIPEYAEAENKINEKAASWQNTIEKEQAEIDELKANLRNEKVLLTKELIEESEEEIKIREIDLKKLKSSYFGTDGDLFFLRKQLVKPIQDLVYNAVQDIAVKRKYDFILDKSTALTMLYTNKQYDISDIVIKSISRVKKVEEVKNKQNKKGKGADTTSAPVLSEEAQKKLDEKELKRAELKKKIEEKRAEQLKKREELLKANEEKKQQRIKEIEEAKNAEDNKNN
ncbi:OmpH family outer membrane protein [Lutibacter holmesii]|uniref:OmpH family outer membrane protein n=1 Tax=Lutibacter holmesii TaxID=1137985 RepID=A0ABW3WRT9_9FLAO